jgi:hypothetical protein
MSPPPEMAGAGSWSNASASAVDRLEGWSHAELGERHRPVPCTVHVAGRQRSGRSWLGMPYMARSYLSCTVDCAGCPVDCAHGSPPPMATAPDLSRRDGGGVSAVVRRSHRDGWPGSREGLDRRRPTRSRGRSRSRARQAPSGQTAAGAGSESAPSDRRESPRGDDTSGGAFGPRRKDLVPGTPFGMLEFKMRCGSLARSCRRPA